MLKMNVITLLLLLLLLFRILSQAFYPWYFSWANCDPHRSGFKYQTAVLSILCLMFLAQLFFFVVNLLTVFLVQLPKFFKHFVTLLVSSAITDIIIHYFFHIIFLNFCIFMLFFFLFFFSLLFPYYRTWSKETVGLSHRWEDDIKIELKEVV
jgi:hypothetical protein